MLMVQVQYNMDIITKLTMIMLPDSNTHKVF